MLPLSLSLSLYSYTRAHNMGACESMCACLRLGVPACMCAGNAGTLHGDELRLDGEVVYREPLSCLGLSRGRD